MKEFSKSKLLNDVFKQVQQVKQTLGEKSKKLNEFSIEVTQLRAHVDKLSEENKKSRSSLEKKENKIDNLEQKLWETEEQLKLERQRFQEQLSQVDYCLKYQFCVVIPVHILRFCCFIILFIVFYTIN